MTRLAENSAEVALDQNLSAYANLRIVLAPPDARGLPVLYAKVLPHDHPDAPDGDHRCQLQFTSLPQDTRDFLDKWQSDG